MARGPVAYPLVASSAPWLIPHSSLRCCGQQAHVARSPSSTAIYLESAAERGKQALCNANQPSVTKDQRHRACYRLPST